MQVLVTKVWRPTVYRLNFNYLSHLEEEAV